MQNSKGKNFIKSKNFQKWTIPLILIVSLMNGLIKSLTGFRYFPLFVDIFIFTYFVRWLFPQILSHRLRISKLDFYISIFLIIAFAQIFNPNVPSYIAGFEGFRKFGFMFLGYFVGRYFYDVVILKRTMIALIVVSFFISIYGIKQYLLPTQLDYQLIELSTASPVTYMMGGHIRAFSTLSGPFHLGIFLTGIILLLVVAQQYKPDKKWIFLILLTTSLIALIMTVTKSNWIGLAIGILFSLLLQSNNLPRLFSRIFIFAILLFVILIFLMSYTTNPIFQTINAGIRAVMNPLDAPTMLIRIESWKTQILPLITSSPWLGYGTGSAGEGLSNYFIHAGSIYVVAHNIFLKVQIELGLVGLLFFLIILVKIFFQILKVRRKLNDRFLLIICDWTLSFFVAIMVTGMVGSILDAYPVNLLFWIIVGVSTKLNKFESVEKPINFPEKNLVEGSFGEIS